MNPLSFHILSRNRLTLLVLLGYAWLMVSCEKDPEPLTTNSVIKGYAYLDDRDYEHPAGINVTASGPYGKKSVTVNEDKFTLSGLGNGTYYLDYTKENYGTVRQYGIQLFGNDTVNVYAAYLYKKPPASFIMPQFTSVSVNSILEHQYNIHITTDYPTHEAYWDVRLYLDDNDAVSCDNYAYALSTNCNALNEIDFTLYAEEFVSGTRVFVIGYSCNLRDYGYLDAYNNEKVISTLNKDNHSNVISFITP